jgi:hypothetical protein
MAGLRGRRVGAQLASGLPVGDDLGDQGVER